MVTGRHRALLDIVIDADDKASKKLDRIGGSFRKFGDVAKKALLIGGAAIVAGAGLAVLGSKVFSAGAQLELLDKKAQTVFGEALPAITKAAEENAAAMGLTESRIRRPPDPHAIHARAGGRYVGRPDRRLWRAL